MTNLSSLRVKGYCLLYLPFAALCSVGPVTKAAATSPLPIEVKAELDRDQPMAGESQRAYLRVVIAGARRPDARRAPMNIALVIDRSGSMSADGRMDNARRAAQMAVDRLGRDDILSEVSYDDRVEVDAPATKVTDPRVFKDRIARLTPRGSTAIHAGLLAGANEIRKFKSRERVNRIILLSDGLANIGPSRPADFVSLGRELASEGITVSTIGLGNGYNEDLMAGLARSADGSHVYVQESADLAGFMTREFNDALGVIGQQVEVIITVRPGIRPMRSLGRDAEIRGERLVYKVGSLIGGVEQVLLAELELAADASQAEGALASIEVGYLDPTDGRRMTVSTAARGRFTGDREASEKSVNAEVMRDVATLLSREARQEAVRLRDAGRAAEANRLFEKNAAFVREQQSKLPGGTAYAPLRDELKANETAASPAAQSSEGWSKARKQQREFDVSYSGAAQRF